MAKKQQKTKKEEEPIEIEKKEEQVNEEVINEKKYTLVELVINSPIDRTWIIYNLGRKGLLGQYEQEIADFGIKDIAPSLTIEEFDEIINGKQ